MRWGRFFGFAIAFAAISFTLPTVRAAGKAPDFYKYKLMPSLGYHVGGSQIVGSNVMSHGPQLSLKLEVERDGWFFIPDVSFAAIFGFVESPAYLLSAGFGAGAMLGMSKFGLWFGLQYQSFLGYGENGLAGGGLRAGSFILLENGNRWNFELDYTLMTEDTTAVLKKYPYISAVLSYVIAIPI